MPLVESTLSHLVLTTTLQTEQNFIFKDEEVRAPITSRGTTGLNSGRQQNPQGVTEASSWNCSSLPAVGEELETSSNTVKCNANKNYTFTSKLIP